MAAGGAALAGAACGPSDTHQAAEAAGVVFPRGEHETFLNAAAGMPLCAFSEAGLARYMDFIRLGPHDGPADYLNTMWSEIRGEFAGLIGAGADEVGLVHATKAGEQLVMDGLPALHEGGNLVSNDFHFSGSLHNLTGMKDAGFDVRIVKSDGKDLPLEAMTRQIDERTALVSITLLSNVNGRVEPVRALADAVHEVGGYLYADIIQAAGVHPIDVEAMGIDFAACSAYKWLFGVHGTGFFYVREGLETTALTRHARYPGNARHNYPPWNRSPDPDAGDFLTRPPVGARRFEPGHVSYLGYCAVYEGLKFIRETGVETLAAHSSRLAGRVARGLDPDRYECTSPEPGSTPIVAFRFDPELDLIPRLVESRIVVSVGPGSLRVSPAYFSTESDVDLLVEVLNG